MHTSDVGVPVNNPADSGYFMSEYDEVLSPEQSNKRPSSFCSLKT